MRASSRSRAWREAGSWLQGLRQASQITMAELAEQVGAPSAAWIDEIETGQRAVPSRFYRSYARALSQDVAAFAADCLGYYDPHAYEALFGRGTAVLRHAA